MQNKMQNNKLALGTVQFGLNYGINNNTGLLDDVNLQELLIYANQNGINTLDTAYNYGNSEKRVGKYLANSNINIKIISKAPKGTNSETIKNHLQESLSNLRTESLFGYLIHDFNDYVKDKKTINKLVDLKFPGIVKKIGFSIYYPEQLEIILSDNCDFDLIQLPYNLADRRFEEYFELLKNKNVEIHIRSVFLQGLFFMEIESLPSKLKPFIEFKKTLNEISNESNRNIENIALNFVYQNDYVDKVVIGVDNKKQLKSNLNESFNKIEPELMLRLKTELGNIEIPQDLLIPPNWN